MLNMKKSNYLGYLNEYQKPISPSKDPGYQALIKSMKHPKPYIKTFKSKSISSNSKNKQKQVKSIKQIKQIKSIKQIKQIKQINQMKQLTNKQNLNPNLKNQEIIESNKQRYVNNSNNKDKNKQNKNILQRLPQFRISFSRCNFQASHSYENLYLIQVGTEQELIVCQKCADKFSSKIKISQLYNKTNIRYSYQDLHHKLSYYQQQNYKLNEIKKLLNNNFKRNIHKIQQYYNFLIHTIVQIKDQILNHIIQLHQINQDKIQSNLQNNIQNIQILKQFIQKIELSSHLSSSDQQLRKMGEQFKEMEQNPIKMSKLELFSTQIQISQTILQTFYHQFITSKFSIQLPSQNQFQQSQEILNQVQKQVLSNKIFSSKQSLSIDFQKLLPSELQKMSSEEELLLESYREEICNSIYKPIQYRHIKQNQQKKQKVEEQGKGTKNFLKQLYCDTNQMQDLFCDQDLTLSTSHPIHAKSKYSPFNRRKAERRIQKMKLSQIEFDSPLNQVQKLDLSSLITHSSIIKGNNLNRNEISFELDENIILEGNILEFDDNQQQNFHIISPAFKLI